MFRIFALLTCIALLAGACTPPAATPAATSAPAPTSAPALQAPSGKITFMVFGGPEEKDAYEKVVAAFAKKNSAVQVQLVHIPSQSDYKKRLAADLIGGVPSDVLIISFRSYAGFAAKGGLEALDPYLQASTVVRPVDFYPQALNAFKYQGKQYCMPQNISSLAVYYNKKLFDEAKVAYPKAGWTWDDFVSTARALTRADQGQYGMATDTQLIRLAPFIWQNGGELVDNMDSPTRLTVDTPQARAALEWFVGLQTKEHVAPDAVANAAQGGEDRFSSGKLAMFLDSRRATTAFRSIKDFDWDVAPLPVQKQAATMLHADGFCVPSSSTNKPAAWALVEFLASAEGQTVLAGTGRIVPSVRSVAESPAFLDPNAKPAGSQVWLDAIPGIHAVPALEQWGEIEDISNKEITRAFYGDAGVDEVIKSMIERTTPVFVTGKP